MGFCQLKKKYIYICKTKTSSWASSDDNSMFYIYLVNKFVHWNALKMTLSKALRDVKRSQVLKGGKKC